MAVDIIVLYALRLEAIINKALLKKEMQLIIFLLKEYKLKTIGSEKSKTTLLYGEKPNIPIDKVTATNAAVLAFGADVLTIAIIAEIKSVAPLSMETNDGVWEVLTVGKNTVLTEQIIKNIAILIFDIL